MKNAIRIQCFAVRIGAGELPREKKLLSFGANPTTKGTLVLGDKTRRVFAQNQKALGFDRVAIDFEHNTLSGTDAFLASEEPREVAAFATPILREDGLWLTEIEWTPAGQAKARNFEDISPAVGSDQTGEVLFLHSAGLCRNGAVYDLRAFSADKILNDEKRTPEQEETMDKILNDEKRTPEQEETIMEKIMAMLRKGLKLDENADELAVAKALEAVDLTGFAAKFAEIEKKIGAAPKAFTAEDGVKLVEKISGLENQIAAHQRDDLVSQAAREGKVIPLSAEQVAATEVVVLRDMVAKLESTVPLDKRTPAFVVPHNVSGARTLTDGEMQIAKLCGVDAEKVQKELGR